MQKFKAMFTVEQIEQAHGKVKSGADFPKYIQEIKALGVTSFETWVLIAIPNISAKTIIKHNQASNTTSLQFQKKVTRKSLSIT